MINTIFSEVYPIADVPNIVALLWIKHYGLTEDQAFKLSDKKIKPYLDTLKNDLFVLVEHPYVDKVYRDTYYQYFSSKLHEFDRDTIRLSFFNREIKTTNFFDKNLKDKIREEETYLGFVTIRPTFPKVIGRSALSPKAKKDDQILCCLARINSTTGHVKYKVLSFPHASQDNQTITCAETTIWSMLEYFGNKYPEYKPVLPSTIHNILNRYSYKRLMPSEGLTAEQVTFAIRELGFGAVIYGKRKFTKPVLFSLINMYIESGIPIIAVLTDGIIGHAVNIVGRQKIDAKFVTEIEPEEVIDYSRITCKYVYIDDNYPPYQLAGLDFPCREYYEDMKKWERCQIKSIIVPLYPKIYLEANRARHNVWSYLKSVKIGLQRSDTHVVKTYLASSRSYKEYLALNNDLDTDIKEVFLGIPMPKFIWVAEIATIKSFEKNLCDGIIVQDATEPISADISEEMDLSLSGHLSLIFGYVHGEYFTQELGIFKKVTNFAAAFAAFDKNLR